MILNNRTPSGRRSGVVLISVLIVLVLLTLAAYQYKDLMDGENRAAFSYTQTLQTRALADSGVAYTMALLSSPSSITTNLNGNPFDNSSMFQGISVAGIDANTSRQGRFTVLSLRNVDDPNFSNSPYVLGVCDESGKINLNALSVLDAQNPSLNIGQTILMGLPNMTEDVANSILDWLDADDTPRDSGAENDYYSSLSPPYSCKNGPIDTLDELLLVKGVTAQLLFGNDRNRNGTLDAGEDASNGGQVDLGWAQYLTVYSREPNIDANGNPRVYLNDSTLSNLQTNLTTIGMTPDLMNFILAYRLYGGSSGGTTTISVTTSGSSGSSTMMMAATPTTPAPYKALSGSDLTAFQTQLATDLADTTKQPKGKISSIFSLSSATVSVMTGSGKTAKTISVPCPLGDPAQATALLPILFDQCTTSQSPDLTPRININTASPTVLSALSAAYPNSISTADVQSILNSQPTYTGSDAPDPSYATPAWLLTKANLSPTTVKALEPLITARSFIYRFQVIGYYDGGGPTSRVEAIVDTSNGRPRLVYQRDLSSLGKAFDPSQLNSN